jgi:protein gp37
MARRLKAMGLSKYSNGFNLSLHEDDLSEPLKLTKPHTIFVCSMSDLFHEDVPFSFIERVMNVIEQTPQHRYQLLTKRAERMHDFFNYYGIIPSNVWLGVTVENKKAKYRIDHLRNLNASVKFLSCEPLLEDLGIIDLTNIDWVIVGGESGIQARPMKGDWAINIESQAKANNVAFFFKQWGTWGSDGVKRNKHVNGKELNGRVIQEMPYL